MALPRSSKHLSDQLRIRRVTARVFVSLASAQQLIGWLDATSSGVSVIVEGADMALFAFALCFALIGRVLSAAATMKADTEGIV